jgi:hypothetical protein
MRWLYGARILPSKIVFSQKKHDLGTWRTNFCKKRGKKGPKWAKKGQKKAKKA